MKKLICSFTMMYCILHIPVHGKKPSLHLAIEGLDVFIVEIYLNNTLHHMDSVYINDLAKIPSFELPIKRKQHSMLRLVLNKKWEFSISLPPKVFKKHALILKVNPHYGATLHSQGRKMEMGCSFIYYPLKVFKAYFYKKKLYINPELLKSIDEKK